MSNDRLDRRRDLMIGALYGELDEDELSEFEAAIAEQEGLRAEWQDLQNTREALHAMGAEEAAPPSNFVLPPQAPTRLASTTIQPRSRWMASAAGFAAAAMIFMGLMVAGLRIDRTPEGVLVRFAPETGIQIGAVQLTGADERFVSRAEFAATTELLVEATLNRLDEIEHRQASTQTEVARSLYGALSERQQMHYADLKHRIDLAALSSEVVEQYGWPVGSRPNSRENHDDND